MKEGSDGEMKENESSLTISQIVLYLVYLCARWGLLFVVPCTNMNL